MTDEEIFLKEGAEYFGNRLIYRNQDVGYKEVESDLALNDHGLEKLAVLKNITDVEIKEPKRKRKFKADGEIDPIATESAELSELLGTDVA